MVSRHHSKIIIKKVHKNLPPTIDNLFFFFHQYFMYSIREFLTFNVIFFSFAIFSLQRMKKESHYTLAIRFGCFWQSSNKNPFCALTQTHHFLKCYTLFFSHFCAFRLVVGGILLVLRTQTIFSFLSLFFFLLLTRSQNEIIPNSPFHAIWFYGIIFFETYNKL